MNEEEKKNENLLSHDGVCPEGMRTQIEEYRKHNHAEKTRGIVITVGGRGMYWFTTNHVSLELFNGETPPTLYCYLCDAPLDGVYSYILFHLQKSKLIDINKKHICCICNRMIKDPRCISGISWEAHAFLFIWFDTSYTRPINVFHLFRYLKQVDKSEADAVRGRFRELGVSIDENILKVFYE